MKHTRKKSIGTKRHMLLLPVFLVAVVALIMGAAAPNSWAEDDGEETPFDVAELFFELNNTDGDLGIHALVDGEPWKKLEIEDPRGRKMLDIYVKGRLRRQGLTELFFESAEPTFDEFSPKRFFRRFREGIYEIEGITLEGDELDSEALLTHVMPAPPEPTVNDEPMAEDCDEESPNYDAPEVNAPVTIAWPAVTMSHDDPEGGGAGVQPPVLVTIVNYELVVEAETEDGFESVFSVILPPDVREVTIPTAFIELGLDEDGEGEFKYEVLAREASYNQTAVESCFVVVPAEE